MFAEELGTNTGRKKAEENRARRKRIQQQTQQKQQSVQALQQQPQQQQQPPSLTDGIISSTTIITEKNLIQNDSISSLSQQEQQEELVAVNPTQQHSLTHTVDKLDNNISAIVGKSPVLISNTNGTGTTTTVASTSTSTATIRNTTATNTTNTTTTTTTNNISVIERAKIDRQIRVRKNLEINSCIIIQSWYRTIVTIQKLKNQYIQQLQKQLSDLITVRTIIVQSKKNKTNDVFTPPLQTTTNLIRQLLFISCTLKPYNEYYSYKNSKRFQHQRIYTNSVEQTIVDHNEDMINSDTNSTPRAILYQSLMLLTPIHLQFVQQIVELCVIPTLSNGGKNNNQKHDSTTKSLFDVWVNEDIDCSSEMTSNVTGTSSSCKVGWYRLRRFIRLLSMCIIHKNTNQKQIDTIVQCMKHILTTTVDQSSTTKITNSSTSSSSIIHSVLFNETISDNWILLIRHYLLFYQRQLSINTNTNNRGTTSQAKLTRINNTITSAGTPTMTTGSITVNYITDVYNRPIIPSDIETKREECFTVTERYRGNRLVQFLFEISGGNSIMDNTRDLISLQTRIVTNILSIPVLLYRIATPTKIVSASVEAVSFLCSTTVESTPATNLKTTVVTSILVQLLHSFALHIGNKRITGSGTITTSISSSSSSLQSSAVVLNSILPMDDVPLTICPARPAQCLLANLIQLGRLCPELDPNSTMISYTKTAGFFDILSLLVDTVPLSTYTTRESTAVEWIDDGKGHLSPIILSNVVLSQCNGILVDSYIRRLFYIATNNGEFKSTMEQIIQKKSDDDKKHEKDMNDAGGSDTSAASLAAIEARIDKSKQFWNTSKWAIQLKKNVTTLFTNNSSSNNNDNNSNNNNCNDTIHPKKESSLLNTSRVSYELASGKKNSSTAGIQASSTESVNTTVTVEPFTLDLLLSICRTYAIFLARWGGSGLFDIIHLNKTTTSETATKKGNRNNDMIATARAEPFTLSLLNVLCFSTPVVRTLWGLLQQPQQKELDLLDSYHAKRILSDFNRILDTDSGKIPIYAYNIIPTFQLRPEGTTLSRLDKTNDGAVILYIFLCTLSHILIITDDIELYDMNKPLPIHQIRRCVTMLKKILFRASCLDGSSTDNSSLTTSHYFGYSLISASSRAMKDLYDRSSRRPFCVPSMWIIPNLLAKEVERCKSCKDYLDLLSTVPALRVCPFLVPFKRRLKLFERIINTNRIEIQGENSANPFHTNPLKPGIPVRITRGRILEDGLLTMNNLGRNVLRQRLQVQYYNEAGVRETGIDAGGLFKDFWTDMCAIAFNPNYALFKVTEAGTAGNCLYPNPLSCAVHGPSDHIILFEFLGRILGKAIYEGITISPRFAHFFLSFLRGDYNFLHMLPDLSTIDPQLYNNLMFLKNYDGDCTDLCLTFTVTADEFGGTKEIPLMSNGSNIEVTNDNKQRYVGLVAKYYVYDRVREQSEAFTRGLWDVLDRSWLQLFNEPELQVLISGIAEGKLDIEDMKAHVQYVGGYTSLDRTISKFWIAVASMNTKQQAGLLRFVTGCERPPPLGFGSMNPPFTIQRVGTGGSLLRGDGDRLPTASTCFNVLKLPCYGNEKILRERLLYAIESGAGFELS